MPCSTILRLKAVHTTQPVYLKFSQPIVGVTPVVVDDCMEVPKIELNLRDNTNHNLTVGQVDSG